MSLHRRLEALEAAGAGRKDAAEIPLALRRYFHALDNGRRQESGLEPLETIPYTSEELNDELKTIDAYKAEPGWRTGEGKEFLDAWERETRERMKGITND